VTTMPTVRLHVRGLEAADEEPLERIMTDLPGVFGAVANHEDRTLEIDFEDDVVSLDELIQAAGSSGFTAYFAG